MISRSLRWESSRQTYNWNICLWKNHQEWLKRNLYLSVRNRQVSSQLKDDLVKEHERNIIKKQEAQKEAKAFQKDFIVSVLYSSATKRDAKSYIQRFAPPKVNPNLKSLAKKKMQRMFYLSQEKIFEPAAILDSPKFIQKPTQPTTHVGESQRHLAVIKIRSIQKISDEVINGIGRTICQLNKLGLTSIVVLDFNDEKGPLLNITKRDSRLKQLEAEQSSRIVNAINRSGESVARLVDNIIGVNEILPSTRLNHVTRTFVAFPELLATQLRQGIIAVVPSIGYTSMTQRLLAVPANEVILALTREFARPPPNMLPDENIEFPLHKNQHILRDENLLDRIILMDPLGGIPTQDRSCGYYVYLNMVQEYDEVKQLLLQDLHVLNKEHKLEPYFNTCDEISGNDKKRTFCPSSEKNSKSLKPTWDSIHEGNNHERSYENLYHLENLKLARNVLLMLPSSSSALLIRPEEVANSTRNNSLRPDLVGTRRQVNPLIHNLLTDKSIFSPSLPSCSKRNHGPHGNDTSPSNMTIPITFAKHGIPVTIFPDPKISHWTPPENGKFMISLTNSEINLPLLINLINDSFGRTLDVPAYLARVNSRIAGVVIAGAYEGGAILTWESPPGVDPTDTKYMVPYLDKFAVLRRSQGSGGVADLVFNCIVLKCFPHGVVWRSRKNNPVNKWYFERSRGTWKLSETDWTMFWTTPDINLGQRPLLLDYEKVCRSIQPTWQDEKDIMYQIKCR